MVHIVAHVSLETSENLKTFKQTVRWDVVKAYAKGPPYQGNLLVSPENDVVREVYQKTFGAGAAGILPLYPEKSMVAEFAMPTRPDLGTVRYQFLTKSGEPVASILMPMWLTAK